MLKLLIKLFSSFFFLFFLQSLITFRYAFIWLSFEVFSYLWIRFLTFHFVHLHISECCIFSVNTVTTSHHAPFRTAPSGSSARLFICDILSMNCFFCPFGPVFQPCCRKATFYSHDFPNSFRKSSRL